MTVSELVMGVPGAVVTGDSARLIIDLVANHTKCTPGSAFVAIRGARFDGHAFVSQAIAFGATALIAEEEPIAHTDATWIRVGDTRRALPRLASTFFGNPANGLRMVGITGTNGKTSTAHLVQELIEASGTPCARLGTIGHEIGGELVEAPNTTPDALELNRLLRDALIAGDRAVAMEVSSHALCTHRVEEVLFDAAIWTNLTQDHLDFHKTMEAYRDAKLVLLRQLKPGAVIALNRDDPSFPDFARAAVALRHARLLSFGLSPAADVRATNVRSTREGSRFDLEYEGRRVPIHLRLLGDYNVSNALAAVAVGIGFGLDDDTLAAGVEALGAVPGRFEPVPSERPFSVVVDYAHTPDALERLLLAARSLNPRRLLVVFGCGGDRDATKRPIMGEIASRLADVAIVTSDNPRTEDPAAIIDQIVAGIDADASAVSIVAREEAIARAISMARDGDIVVIAGKGHEDYQIVGTTKTHFDDREVARRYLDRG